MFSVENVNLFSVFLWRVYNLIRFKIVHEFSDSKRLPTSAGINDISKELQFSKYESFTGWNYIFVQC